MRDSVAKPPRLPAALARAVTLVRDDREHGASWLARQVALALAEAAEEQRGHATARRLVTLRAAAQAFARARPSMAAVANTAAHIWQAASMATSQGPDAQVAALRAEAERLAAQWERAASAIAGYARPLLGPVVYTHSRSGTVEQVLLQLAARGGWRWRGNRAGDRGRVAAWRRGCGGGASLRGGWPGGDADTRRCVRPVSA